MSRNRIGPETAMKLAAVWSTSQSLRHAFERIGISTKDTRTMYLYRRQAEDFLGYALPSLNPQNKTSNTPDRSEYINFKGCKTFAVFSDAHIWPNYHSSAMSIFLQIVKDIQPDYVIDNGDSLDAPSISRHAPNTWQEYPDVADEIAAVNQYLRWVKEQCPKKTKFFRTIGNHDLRIEAKLQQQVPQFKGVKGFTISEQFPGWEHNYSLVVNKSTVIKHRWHGGMHSAYQNVLKSGLNMVTGHTHKLRHSPWTDYSGTRYGIETGTLADHYHPAFEYIEDNPRNWQSGFVILTIDGDRTEDLHTELVEVKNGIARFRGNEYKE